MLIAIRKKYMLRIADVYFSEDCSERGIPADAALFLQCSTYEKGFREFHTLHIDLTKSRDAMLSEMDSHTRTQIRKQSNEDIFKHSIADNPYDEEIKEFADCYNKFARIKGLCGCNVAKLKALQAAGGLVISKICDLEGNILCCNAYISDGIRARILYSVSLYRMPEYYERRNCIGRAHRYMNWLDIMHFKDKGLRIYDLGGLAIGSKDENMANINNFKLGFGGSVVTEYNACKAISIPGLLAAAAYGLRR